MGVLLKIMPYQMDSKINIVEILYIISIKSEVKRLESENHSLKEKVKKVVLAIEDKGKNPAYHNFLMEQHKKDWLILWVALDDLVDEYNRMEKEG